MRNLLVLLLLTACGLEACSVPVFAYALRRWAPDRHLLSTARPAAWREDLGGRAIAAGLNLEVAEGSGTDRLSHPYLDGVWWEGELDEARASALPSSPARAELVRRLASGQTAVWLFVPGGDAAAAAAARHRLEAELARLTTELRLPELDHGDPSTATTMAVDAPPPRLEFSILDLDPTAAAEWVLLAQIEALAAGARGPLAVPVYGRGRALAAIHDGMFSDGHVEALAAFLCGVCSCQAKELNPGWDLLLACDWDERIALAARPAAPTPPAAAAVAAAADREESQAWLWVALSVLPLVLGLAWIILRGIRSGD